MSDKGDPHDPLRRLMDSQLLSSSADCVHMFFNDLTSACQQRNIHFDFRAALEYWWELARMGIVAVPGAELGSLLISGRFRKMVLTERGRRLLEHGEASPHDPRKYLDSIRRRIPEADPVALVYLNEAVGAWSCGLNRSSAVMLGCACERLVLLLAEAVGALSFPEAKKVKKALEVMPVRISSLFDSLRTAVLSAKEELPGDLRDALDRKLSAVFDHARGLRNQSGHPTGNEVSADDAQAGLLLFPGFCQFIDALIKHLDGLKTDSN